MYYKNELHSNLKEITDSSFFNLNIIDHWDSDYLFYTDSDDDVSIIVEKKRVSMRLKKDL